MRAFYVQFRGPHYETPAEVLNGQNNGRRYRRNVNRTRGHCRKRIGYGDPRNVANYEPGRGHPKDSAQPRREVIEAGQQAEARISKAASRNCGQDLSQLVDQARAWLDQDPDPVTKLELQALIDNHDEEGLASRFSSRLDFGDRRTAGRTRGWPEPNEPGCVVAQTALGIAEFLNNNRRHLLGSFWRTKCSNRLLTAEQTQMCSRWTAQKY